MGHMFTLQCIVHVVAEQVCGIAIIQKNSVLFGSTLTGLSGATLTGLNRATPTAKERALQSPASSCGSAERHSNREWLSTRPVVASENMPK